MVLDCTTILEGFNSGAIASSTAFTAGGSATTIWITSALFATTAGELCHLGKSGWGVRFQAPARIPAAA